MAVYDVTMRPGQPLSTLHGPLLKEAPAMTDLTREQEMETRRLAVSDAVKMLRMVASAPACNDGFVCAEDLSSNEQATAWALVGSGLLIREQLAQVKSDVDGEPMPVWGFGLSSEGAGLLALLDAADERDKLKRDLDAARAAVEKLAGENHSLGCRDCIAYVIGRGCPRVQDAPVGEWVSCRQARKEAAYAPAPVPDAQGEGETEGGDGE